MLRELERVTGADAVFLTEVHWARLDQEVRFSTSSEVVAEGTLMPWPGSPCCAMLAGGARLLPDLRSRHAGHPLVRAAGASALATVPLLTPEGAVFGTLCAVSRRPAGLAGSSVVLLELFARLLVEHVARTGEGAELFAGGVAS